MATSKNPIKVLQVEGQIAASNNVAVLKKSLNISYAEFGIGVWQIAVKDIVIKRQDRKKEIKKPSDKSVFEISSNFVLGQYKQTTERIPIPLARVSNEPNYPTELIVLNPRSWFVVNSYSSSFEAYISECTPNLSPMFFPLNFEITFHLQRIE